MVAFMADVLIPEDMTVDLDFISQIVFLVIDLGVIGIMLRCKIRCQNPDWSVVRLHDPIDDFSPVCHIVDPLHWHFTIMDSFEKFLAILRD
jgi:hypothetical protein